jgi:hypothetical protein
METTKIKKRQKLFLPKELMDVLRWHVEQQIPESIVGEMSRDAGLPSQGVLGRPAPSRSGGYAGGLCKTGAIGRQYRRGTLWIAADGTP